MDTESVLLEFGGILTRQTNRISAAAAAALSDRSSAAFSSTVTDTLSYELAEDEEADEINKLRTIIHTSNSRAFVAQCLHLYISSRKLIVDTKFQLLGVGNHSVADFRSLDSEMLAPKIKVWSRAARFCFQHVFVSEKKLFQQIFGALFEEGFVGIVQESALHLLNFAEAVTSSRPSFLKLFEILDLYVTLSDVLPALNPTFSSKLSESVNVRNEAARTVDMLVELVRNMLTLFENSVLHEQLNRPVLGGTIHSLTKYAMSYILRCVDYKQVLTHLIISNPISSLATNDDMEFLEDPGKSPLALHLIWILISLKFNLEDKSKHYEDESLGHFFLMNNVRFIIQKVEGSSAVQDVIGIDYITKLGDYVLKQEAGYIEKTWKGVIHCLRSEGLHSGYFCTRKLSKATLKDRFRSFNLTFEEVCQTQSTWLVMDPQLRRQLHHLILQRLTPEYDSFLHQFRSHIETEKHPERYIKYSVHDIENAVSGLFAEH